MKTSIIEFKDKSNKFYPLFPIDELEAAYHEDGFRTTKKTDNRVILRCDDLNLTDEDFEIKIQKTSDGLNQVFRKLAKQMVGEASKAVPSWNGEVLPIQYLSYGRHDFVSCACDFTDNAQTAVFTIDGEWKTKQASERKKPTILQRLKGLIR